MRRATALLEGALVLCLLVLTTNLGNVCAASPSLERVSVSTKGAQANGECLEVALSADGRYVAFSSRASNLVPGDANDAWDVFVRDRVLGTTERVSVSVSDEEGNGDSGRPAISEDGRFVAFVSDADSLVPGDANDNQDVFVRDRQKGETERVSIGNDGAEGNGDSGWFPAMSAGGRFVAFVSMATNLVEGDTNDKQDVFVRDRQKGQTERVSVSSAGEQTDTPSGWFPAISADGRYVAFTSTAANLVADDTNLMQDVFVRDRRQGTTERVSVGISRGQADGGSLLPAISADGRFVAFVSSASNLVATDANEKQDIFVRDRVEGRTYRVSIGNGGEESDDHSFYCSISADGRWVAFHSSASNLVAGDTNEKQDVVVRDRKTGTTERVSVSTRGEQGNGDSVGPAISGDGRCAAFLSSASNLVEGDTNEQADVFLCEHVEGAE